MTQRDDIYREDEMTSKIQSVIDSLNIAFEADPIAIRALLVNVVPCNDVLAAHSTVICNRLEEGYTVGCLGILNGVLGALSLPLVASKWSDEVDSLGRRRLLGFCEYVP